MKDLKGGLIMQIEFKNLTKKFEDGRVVLDHLNLMDEIETLAIIGPSGGGKSTLLRIIGGLISQTEGSLFVDGQKVEEDEKLFEYRKEIGFVFQQNGLFSHLTALENITVPLIKVHGYSKEEARKRGEELLERFGLLEDGKKKPSQLSGGQIQRISIARAISTRPKFLLLDEPTSALDPEYTTEVLDMIQELKEEGTKFIIVTHEMGFARHACEKVAFLYGGQLREYGMSKDLFTNPQTDELKNFLSKLLEWNV